MCSWCWGFQPAINQLIDQLPANVELTRLLGGLAPDSEELMPEDMKVYLQDTWNKIQTTIPGTKFNFDFWTACTPRRSTYPACRGVIAARMQGQQFDTDMTSAIQKAYYLDAKNPSDDSTLIGLAKTLGLDAELFCEALNSAAVQQQLLDEIDFSRQLGIQGFPSLMLINESVPHRISMDYRGAESMLSSINAILQN